MKVLVLSSHTPSLFWFRMDMMKAFISKGADVIAVGNEQENEWFKKFQREGIRYRYIPVSRNGLSAIGDVRTFNALRKIIKEERPEKIFTYQAKTIVYGILAAHLVDSSISNYPLVAGLGSIFRGTSIKSKIIRIILGYQYRLAFRYSKKVFFQNNDDKNELIKAGVICEEKTTMINGSGVNLDKFTVQPFPKDKAILFIGRLIRDKGVGEYLELAKRIKDERPSVRCLLVGPFDSNPSAITPEDLRPLIDNGTIEYFGEQADVRAYLKECTVYVLPSYHEGTPKTVLEAMACGRPIVTTDAPGCRETVRDGENGYLVPIKDVDKLKEMVTILLDNHTMIEEFGKVSREMVMEKYDVNKVNESIIKAMDL